MCTSVEVVNEPVLGELYCAASDELSVNFKTFSFEITETLVCVKLVEPLLLVLSGVLFPSLRFLTERDFLIQLVCHSAEKATRESSKVVGPRVCLR